MSRDADRSEDTDRIEHDLYHCGDAHRWHVDLGVSPVFELLPFHDYLRGFKQKPRVSVCPCAPSDPSARAHVDTQTGTISHDVTRCDTMPHDVSRRYTIAHDVRRGAKLISHRSTSRSCLKWQKSRAFMLKPSMIWCLHWCLQRTAVTNLLNKKLINVNQTYWTLAEGHNALHTKRSWYGNSPEAHCEHVIHTFMEVDRAGIDDHVYPSVPILTNLLSIRLIKLNHTCWAVAWDHDTLCTKCSWYSHGR